MGKVGSALIFCAFLAGTSAYADPCQVQVPDLEGPVSALVNDVEPVIKYEIGLGKTHFSALGNGNWYQEGFPYELDLSSNSYSIGISKKLEGPWKSWKVRAGYEYVGTAKSSALATASDDNYAVCRYDHSKCWPLSHWYGVGRVRELYFAADREFKVMGTKPYLEVGFSVYKPEWKMTIPDWRPTADANPRLLVVTHDPKLQTSMIWGFGFNFEKDVSLGCNIQELSADGDPWISIYHGWHSNCLLRKGF